MQAIIIGGGIIGLSSALYLKNSGWDVTVIDKGDLSNNCSYGNAGYVCPSHFIPLATPGIIRQGIVWMTNPKSPFFVQPRLDWGLMDWGVKFIKSARAEKVKAAAVPLRDIAIISQQAYESWMDIPGMDLAYEKKGILEYFKTPEKEEHAHHTCEDAVHLGIDAVMLSREEVQAMEPHTTVDIKGALYFRTDAHVYPDKVMRSLIKQLQESGVIFRTQETVTGFERSQGVIKKVITDKAVYDAGTVVLSGGSWSRGIAAQLSVSLPMVGGRGYSLTLTDSPYRLNHPAILMEGRVAITPMDGNKIRFGGTMEITGLDQPPRMNRVAGILDAVKQYLPQFQVAMPTEKEIWYGYRPCSADGLPYIGRSRQYSNLIIATGHAMIGMSLGAGTGKIVGELANEQALSMDIHPFDPGRFQN